MDSRFDALPQEWRAALFDWLESIQAISGSTRSAGKYADVLALFVRFLNGRRVADATRADVEAFAKSGSFNRYRPGVPVSISCRNGRVSAIASFFKHCATYEVTPGQPLYTAQLPTQGVKFLRDGARPRSLTQEQLARLFAQMDRSTIRGKRDYALYLFYLMSARRLSEVQRLTWGDLSYVTVVDGAVRRRAWVYSFANKGRSREKDSAEISDVVIDALDDYLVASGRKASMTPSTPLWVSLYPGRGRHNRDIVAMTHTQITSNFKAYLRAAGLPESGVHILRHCSAKLRYESGQGIREVQRALRHSSLATTSRYLESLCSEADSGQAAIAAQLPFLASAGSEGSLV